MPRSRVIVRVVIVLLLCAGAAFVLIGSVLIDHREAVHRTRVSHNLKELSVAMGNWADTHGRLVPYAICDKDGKPLLSWRVALLPYIEQDGLYQQFKRDEVWDGPNNSRLIALMPSVYAHPKDPDASARGQTHYRVFTGPETPFPDPEPPFPPGFSPVVSPGNFNHGMSNTILIAEAAEAVPWTKPDEMPYDPNRPLPRLGGYLHRGFVVAMGDGSSRLIYPPVNEQELRDLITRHHRNVPDAGATLRAR
jgi:hypothetical protein